MDLIHRQSEYLAAAKREMQREGDDRVKLRADRVDAHAAVWGSTFPESRKPLLGILARQLRPALIERRLELA